MSDTLQVAMWGGARIGAQWTVRRKEVDTGEVVSHGVLLVAGSCPCGVEDLRARGEETIREREIQPVLVRRSFVVARAQSS